MIKQCQQYTVQDNDETICLPAEIPYSDSSSNDHLMTGKYKLYQPEDAEDIVPLHIIEYLILFKLNKACVLIDLRLSSSLNEHE